MPNLDLVPILLDGDSDRSGRIDPEAQARGDRFELRTLFSFGLQAVMSPSGQSQGQSRGGQ